MSEEEQRTIRAMALLEVEEAKQHLGLLQAKLDGWQSLHEKVHILLVRGRRTDPHLERAAVDARADVIEHRQALAGVMDLDAILDLDGRILAAVARLKKAIETRKSLGFA